jgi:hypothetical protein
MEYFSTAPNASGLPRFGIDHENPKAAIALENGIHHDAIAKLENVEGEMGPWKQDQFREWK